MSFGECELALLRQSIDKIQKLSGSQRVKDPTIKNIIEIIEEFMIKKKLICYGGTAVNNILPKKDRFYDLSIELPDYDMYSNDALKHAIQLADLYYKKGFTEVEAKTGIHPGTYKVFVNFIPIADITNIPNEMFKSLSRSSKSINKIQYAPINYLRMSMYNELSRPKGDTTRWEKIMKRLTLLNKHFPLKGENCDNIQIQRPFENLKGINEDEMHKLFRVTRDLLIEKKCVFFGALASEMYMKYNKAYKSKNTSIIPDFDVISEKPNKTALALQKELENNGFANIIIKERSGINEIIPDHIEIIVDGNTVAFIYKTVYCHSYNIVKQNGKNIRIATIDTMLTFYLAFLYLNRDYYNKDRILCMSEFLFKIQQSNRLKQKGILKRFSIECYGVPLTLQKIRSNKNELFKSLRKKRITYDFIKSFLRYSPGTKQANIIKRTIKSSRKTRSKKSNLENKTSKTSKNREK